MCGPAAITARGARILNAPPPFFRRSGDVLTKDGTGGTGWETERILLYTEANVCGHVDAEGMLYWCVAVRCFGSEWL